ncbi:MAG: Crp/Fnr family transcriptional regulator [Ramlibacter sp.]
MTAGAPHCAVCATRARCIVGAVGAHAARLIQPHIVPVRLERGDLLSEEGAASGATRSIKLGSALVMRRGATGELKPVAMIGRGAPVGLLGFFGLRNQTSVVAAGPVHACDVPHEGLRRCALAEPAIDRRLLELAARATGNIADWSAGVRETGTVNQVAHVLLLLQQAEGSTVMELPQHKDLADLLGARRETVARALSALEAEGALRSMGRRRWELAPGRLRERLGPSAPASASATG